MECEPIQKSEFDSVYGLTQTRRILQEKFCTVNPGEIVLFVSKSEFVIIHGINTQ